MVNELKCIIDPCITIEQAAEIFKVSSYTVKRWLRTGKLRGIKLPGNQWRTTYKACQEILDKGKE